MRFSCDVVFNNEGAPKIPTNYRRDMASLIKEGLRIENPELRDQLWGTDEEKLNKDKPFTFAVYIPGVKNVKDGGKNFLEFNGDSIRLSVSSYNTPLLMNIYNGLLNVSGKYRLFNNDVNLKNFHLGREFNFRDESYIFSLLSPMVVRDKKDEAGKEYVASDKDALAENVYYNVLHMCREFIDKEYVLNRESFEFIPDKTRIVKVHHYREVIPAVAGTFSIKAPVEVLKMIYDAGIGARRSQGFGMVEVVK